MQRSIRDRKAAAARTEGEPVHLRADHKWSTQPHIHPEDIKSPQLAAGGVNCKAEKSTEHSQPKPSTETPLTKGDGRAGACILGREEAKPLPPPPVLGPKNRGSGRTLNCCGGKHRFSYQESSLRLSSPTPKTPNLKSRTF